MGRSGLCQSLGHHMQHAAPRRGQLVILPSIFMTQMLVYGWLCLATNIGFLLLIICLRFASTCWMSQFATEGLVQPGHKLRNLFLLHHKWLLAFVTSQKYRRYIAVSPQQFKNPTIKLSMITASWFMTQFQDTQVYLPHKRYWLRASNALTLNSENGPEVTHTN